MILIYVVLERWSTSIGRILLDAVIDETNRRGCRRIVLWTHERRNHRPSIVPQPRLCHHRAHDDEGQLIGEGRYDCE